MHHWNSWSGPIASCFNIRSEVEVVPEGDDDGGGLRAGSDERDDEEEDEERDEGVAGAVALPRHGVAVLVQVGLDDDELQLVAALTARWRRYDLPALDAGALWVVTDLKGKKTKIHLTIMRCFQPQIVLDISINNWLNKGQNILIFLLKRLKKGQKNTFLKT